MSLCIWGLPSQTTCPSTVKKLNMQIGNTAMTLSRLTKCVWSNNKLSDQTKVNVYKACVISTLHYGSESWTMRAHQEKRLNVFHMRCLRRVLGITWQDKVTNKVGLERAGIPSLYTLKAKAHAMARTCDTDGRWPHSKRPFIWQTGDREKTNRMTPTTLQGCMQARPPGTWHKHRLLGSYCHRQRFLKHSKTGVDVD